MKSRLQQVYYFSRLSYSFFVNLKIKFWSISLCSIRLKNPWQLTLSFNPKLNFALHGPLFWVMLVALGFNPILKMLLYRTTLKPPKLLSRTWSPITLVFHNIACLFFCCIMSLGCRPCKVFFNHKKWKRHKNTNKNGT
jgi:hypothetical protein